MIHYFFLTQKPHHCHQYKKKRRIKKTYKNKPVRLYIWIEPIKHIENYKLTVIKHKNESKRRKRR